MRKARTSIKWTRKSPIKYSVSRRREKVSFWTISFSGADLVGEGFIHGDAGATEPGAEDKGSGILESSGKGGSVEVKANVSGFGDVAIEIGSSLVSVMDEVIDGFTNGFVGVLRSGSSLSRSWSRSSMILSGMGFSGV